MEQAIQDTKIKRSRLKAKLTSSTKLLKTASKANSDKLYGDVTDVYSELLTVHYQYVELVETDEKFSTHRSVGGLDLNEYEKGIESLYTNAMTLYAASLGDDVSRALKKCDFYFSELQAEVNDGTLYIIQQSETHLSLCRDLFVTCGSMQCFDSSLAEELDNAIFKLGRGIHGCKHIHSAKAVRFDNTLTQQSSRSSPHTGLLNTHSLSQSDMVQGDTVPQLESTRVSLDVRSHDGPGAASPTTSFAPPGLHTVGANNVSLGIGSDTSVVTAYQSGASKPVAYPLANTNSLHTDSSDNSNVSMRSKFCKTPLPTFSGDRNEWPEFRSVWLMHAQHEFVNDTERAWALKSCLKGRALEVVKAVLVTQPAAYTRILKRLDDFFCDVSLNIQNVTEEFKKLKPVQENDFVGLVNFANQVEMCYSQLGEVGQINSVVMPQIDQLVDLLPVSSRKDWMKIIKRSSLEQQVHPFSPFMTYLEEERDTCMKLAERQRRQGGKSAKMYSTEIIAASHSSDAESTNDIHEVDRVQVYPEQSHATHYNQSPVSHNNTSNVVCIIHNTSHPSHECKKFLAMGVRDRIQAVKNSQACYRCFGKHQVRTCKSTAECKTCKLSNHHDLLCLKQVGTTTGSESTHASSSAASNTKSCPALLLIQQVSVVGSSSTATVFFDSGSNATFITHTAAKRMNAKRLRPIELDLTTTGNVESQHSTYLYEVNLRCSSQQIVKILCFGLEEITGKVSALHLQVIQELFPGIVPDLLQRKSDGVDILMGGDYCGLHPRREVASAGEHLKVLEGPFGLCLHGSHPRLWSEGTVASQFTQVTGLERITSPRVQSHHVEFVRPSTSHYRTKDSPRVDAFIEGETLGTELAIRCGNCKCGKCPITGHTYSFREEDYPDVSRLLRKSTYVDDIVDSVDSGELALQLAHNTSQVLKEAGFTIKHGHFSGETSPRLHLGDPPGDPLDHSAQTQVLGVTWAPVKDKIMFHTKLNFSPKKKGVYTQPDLTVDQVPQSIPFILTRRSVLEQTMRIYDPLGILSPFLLKAKILLRETWLLKLDWDDALPTNLRSQWVKFLTDMFKLSTMEYDRCLKPPNAIGNPILVIMSDASDMAYGFSAYARWQLEDGQGWSRLIFSKCRIAPLKKLSTPQMELNGAVLSKRARKVLEQEMRFDFSRVYHLVDSETVLCMLNKVSTRFKLFEGVRVGEIQAATEGDMSSWFWVKGTLDTADWLTRGKDLLELGADSQWGQGPGFLALPEEAWEVKSYSQCREVADLEGLVAHASTISSPTYLLDYTKFSRFMKYVWIIARVYYAIRSRKFSAMGQTTSITPLILDKAKTLIIKDVQQTLVRDLRSSTGRKGKYSRLHPVRDDCGVWVVGNRLIRSNPMAISPQTLPALIPDDHPMAPVLLQEAHVRCGHRGRDVTLATFRQEYWIANGSRAARKTVNDCQKCRIRDQKLMSQEMGKLPSERLVPGPPFNNTMVDFFGPYLIRGETQSRVSKKAYGVPFTDLGSRAVHIEASFGYDTSSFLLTLKRFTTLRGWPSVIFSDPGSQLVGADKELVSMWKSMDKEDAYKACSENGTRWVFGPADSSWHQGAVEVLVKAAKWALKFSINDQRLSASELLTVFTETANLLNERPIGTLPCEDSEIGVLTPNCLLIGRPTARNPEGWAADISIKGRIQHVGQIVQQFWDCWTKLYAPTLVYQRKWKQNTRSLQPGDVVAIADSNSLRGQYRIGLVKEVYPGIDGIVRRVSIAYKSFRVGESVYEYGGAKDVVIMRSVQRLALLVPVSERPG